MMDGGMAVEHEWCGDNRSHGPHVWDTINEPVAISFEEALAPVTSDPVNFTRHVCEGAGGMKGRMRS